MRGSLRALPAAGLLAAGLAVGPAAPAAAQPSGTWTRTGSMTTPDESQTGTVLQNGQVLVIHGAASELYNPATGKWTATGSMTTARSGYTATVLQNGQVLVAGGGNCVISGCPALASAELYNPATGTWAPTGSMTAARRGHTATLLPTGQVLVAGGDTCLYGGCPALASAELYNPATGTWSATGSMNVARVHHTATLLPNGQVLAAGGDAGSAELYNPATGRWTPTGSMGFDHSSGAVAGLLPNGQVLVVCGVFDPGVAQCAADLYNPATGTWADDGTASQPAARNFTATLLHNGQVLLAGGENGGYPAKVTISEAAVLFDPATRTSTSTGSMTIPREFTTLTVLPNGQVLAAGGETQNKQGTPSLTASAELYTP
jgi:N-acetylneuraminic acid mutarotase